MRILIVEDDEIVANAVRRALGRENYSVDLAVDSSSGMQLAHNYSYDLMILDIILPDGNGLEICRSVRMQKLRAKILLLTGLGNSEDIVSGLDSGADDYLCKPFCMEELLARIRAIFRRDDPTGSPTLDIGDLSMDTTQKIVSQRSEPISLTKKEYAILEYLMHHPNLVISKSVLEEHVWGMDYSNDSNLMDVYIGRLRRKFQKTVNPQIKTVRGHGYQLTTE